MGSRTQNTPKKGHFMDAESVWKFLKIYNLTTTDDILMKLATVMYLHKFILLKKKVGRNLKGVRGRKGKASQNDPQNEFFGSVWLFLKTTIKSEYMGRIILNCINDQNLKQIWQHLGDAWPKTTQKQSKMIVSAGTKTFESLKTRELQILCKWNLPDICTTWTLFIYQKLKVLI